MSCFGGSKGKVDVEAVKVSASIEASIKAERQEMQSLQIILLLGTGNAGKSTFAKQVCYLLGSKQNHDEYKDDLKMNTLDSLKTLLRVCERERIALEGVKPEMVPEFLREPTLNMNVARVIENLYK